MPRINRSAFFLVFFICAGLTSARAQTPSIEVMTDSDGAQFSTRGKAQSVHVEVYAPSGELVFEADSFAGQAVDWPMTDRKGERVADGVYLATITVTDSSGKRRKRVEQLTVSSKRSAEAAAAAETPAPQESLAPTGSGTAGRIAKWTSASSLGNSAVTESAAGNIGVNTTPAAVLHVNKGQPVAVAVNGTAATTLLQTSGGKGGNTTVGGGKVAGAGAGIALYAGSGGDAPAGSKNGGGGNVVLQAGSAGAGAGAAGANGNVLINPTGVGNVGVGTSSATSRLTVSGRVQTLGAGNGLTLGSGGSIKFANGSVQTTAALPMVQHDATLAGAGTAASPLGIAAGGVGTTQLADSSVTAAKVGVPLALSGSSSGTPTLSAENTGGGTGINGQANGVANPAIYGYNTAAGGKAIWGYSPSGIGVEGQSGSSHGVFGYSSFNDIFPVRAGVYGEGHQYSVGVYGKGDNTGVYGEGTSSGVSGSGSTRGVHGSTASGDGVYGTSSTGNGVYGQSFQNDPNSAAAGVYGYNPNSGWAGYFEGKLKVTGGCAGCTAAVSDRALKANFSAINPRSLLDRLASLPIREWSYKSDEPSVRHVGPMAQDFRAAFQLGRDDKHIDMIDASGVTMAAVQALYRQNQELTRTVERQAQENRQQDDLIRRQGRRMEQMLERLAQVERSLKKRRNSAKRR